MHPGIDTLKELINKAHTNPASQKFVLPAIVARMDKLDPTRFPSGIRSEFVQLRGEFDRVRDRAAMSKFGLPELEPSLALLDQYQGEEPPDILHQVYSWAKSKPLVAWPIILFFVFGAVAAWLDAILTILDRFRD